MDQRVTVYIQQGAMNGSISDGGRMIALSKQFKMEYKRYQCHRFKDVKSTMILVFFVKTCRNLDDCKLHI